MDEQTTPAESTKTEDEVLHVCREGTFKSFIKETLKKKDKGMTKEFVEAMIKHLDKYTIARISAACDAAEESGRKGVTAENLKTGMERDGIEL